MERPLRDQVLVSHVERVALGVGADPVRDLVLGGDEAGCAGEGDGGPRTYKGSSSHRGFGFPLDGDQRQAHHRPVNPDAAMTETGPPPPQACAGCGRSTAAGTPLFSGRRVIPPAADDTAAESSYLCEECAERIHIAAREARLSDEQLREKIESGEIQGMTYKGLGSFTGFLGGDGGLT
jgi:hypothetical protein